EQMGDNAQPTSVGGVGGFAFPGFGGGGGNRRNLDSTGNPRQVTLTLGVDERNNSLLVTCSEAMKKDIEKVIEYMEKGSKESKRVVRIVPLKGVDPYIVQQAIDAIQGRPVRQSPNAGMQGGVGGGMQRPGGFGGGFGGPG